MTLLEPVPTIADYYRAPLGHYFVGRRYFVWCHGPRLAGSCLWGRLNEKDVAELAAFIDWRPEDVGMAAPFDLVTDCRGVEAIDPDAYRFVAEKYGPRLARLGTILRRHAFVGGGGFVGAVLAGVFPLAGQSDSWRPFDGLEPAFAWLAPAKANDALTQLRVLTERLTGAAPTLASLRDLLATALARGRAPELDEAARLLGRSARSLQRDLRDAGTNFRAEIDQARIAAVRSLLADTDLKLEAIARQVGCASASQLVRLFRRCVGETPSQFRARRR
jgi:AraC-like DNA-binding protein